MGRQSTSGFNGFILTIKRLLRINGSDPDKFLKKSDKDREGVLIKARQAYFSNIVNITVIGSVAVFISGLTMGPWIEITWNLTKLKGMSAKSKNDLYSLRMHYYFIGKARGNIEFMHKMKNVSFLYKKELMLIEMREETIVTAWGASKGLAAIAIACGMMAVFLNYFKLFNSRWSLGNDGTPTVLMYFPLIMAIYLIMLSIMKYTHVLQIFERHFDRINIREQERKPNSFKFDTLCINPPGKPYFVSMIGLFFHMVTLVFTMDYYDPA